MSRHYVTPTSRKTGKSFPAATAIPFRVPLNIEAERSVLGSIFVEPKLLEDIIECNLLPNDFYLPAHRIICRRILELARATRPVDIIAVAEELETHQELDAIGGRPYLGELTDLVVPEKRHVAYHCSILKSKARLRRIQALGERAQVAAGAPGADPIQLGQQLVDEIGKIIERAKNDLQNSRN